MLPGLPQVSHNRILFQGLLGQKHSCFYSLTWPSLLSRHGWLFLFSKLVFMKVTGRHDAPKCSTNGLAVLDCLLEFCPSCFSLFIPRILGLCPERTKTPSTHKMLFHVGTSCTPSKCATLLLRFTILLDPESTKHLSDSSSMQLLVYTLRDVNSSDPMGLMNSEGSTLWTKSLSPPPPSMPDPVPMELAPASLGLCHKFALASPGRTSCTAWILDQVGQVLHAVLSYSSQSPDLACGGPKKLPPPPQARSNAHSGWPGTAQHLLWDLHCMGCLSQTRRSGHYGWLTSQIGHSRRGMLHRP